MKHVTIVCDLIATDEFDEQEVKKMLDASEYVKEAHMQVKIETLEKGGDNDGIQHPGKRW